MTWPWQWRKKWAKVRSRCRKLDGDITQYKRLEAKWEKEKEQLTRENGALKLRLQDLEAEVGWLRELQEAGAMAIVVSKANMDEFVTALKKLQDNSHKGGE